MFIPKIKNYHQSIKLQDIDFPLNGYSVNDGGAIMNDGYLKVINSTFVNNTAKYSGGAIWYADAYNCTFINNSAYVGGAIWYGDAYNCTFISNIAFEGGAIGTYHSICSVVNCSFVNNTAKYIGGSIRVYYGILGFRFC